MNLLKKNTMLADAVQNGKQAIAAKHRALIIETSKIKCHESLDFDGATTQLRWLPERKRWDYFVSIGNDNPSSIAIEVHPFKESELIGKKRDTIFILDQHCPGASDSIKSWHVLVTSELRSDMASRFTADTRIKLHRKIFLKDI